MLILPTHWAMAGQACLLAAGGANSPDARGWGLAMPSQPLGTGIKCNFTFGSPPLICPRVRCPALGRHTGSGLAVSISAHHVPHQDGAGVFAELSLGAWSGHCSVFLEFRLRCSSLQEIPAKGQALLVLKISQIGFLNIKSWAACRWAEWG